LYDQAPLLLNCETEDYQRQNRWITILAEKGKAFRTSSAEVQRYEHRYVKSVIAY
jgi:hypothetical protein